VSIHARPALLVVLGDHGDGCDFILGADFLVLERGGNVRLAVITFAGRRNVCLKRSIK
jgi:hypothetical protein